MIWIVILLSLAVGLADGWFYRRHLRGCSRAVRTGFIAATAFTDALPLLVGCILSLLRDNSTAVVAAAMWFFFVYMLAVLPRMAYYFFHHFGLKRTGRIAALIAALWLVWGATYGRTAYVVNEVELHYPQLPAAFDGLRIVQFSDVHIGTLLCRDRELQRLTDTLNALRPDMVFFTGDLVNVRYTELDAAAMHILGAIEAPLGVISNLGNHDTGVYVKDTLALPVEVNTARLVERQRAMGWQLPDNETLYLTRGRDTIAVTGLSFDPAFRRQRHDRTLEMDLAPAYQGVPQEYFNITVSHLPQLWEQIRALGYGDLTLAGHIHAMQMSLNLGRLRLSPARLFYKRWSGLYGQDGRYLYINDGIGYVGFPMRLGAYPEITVITLKR